MAYGIKWSIKNSVFTPLFSGRKHVTVMESGNHSLETENPMRNLDILKKVVEKTRRFIRRENV